MKYRLLSFFLSLALLLQLFPTTVCAQTTELLTDASAEISLIDSAEEIIAEEYSETETESDTESPTETAAETEIPEEPSTENFTEPETAEEPSTESFSEPAAETESELPTISETEELPETSESEPETEPAEETESVFEEETETVSEEETETTSEEESELLYTLSEETTFSLQITQQPEAVTTGAVNSLPSLSVTAEISDASDTDTVPEISYQWYSCGLNGEYADAVDGAVSDTLTPEAVPGIHYYFCEISAEGCESVSTDVSAVILAYEGKTVVTSLSLSSTDASEDHLEDQGWKWDQDSMTLTISNLVSYNGTSSNIFVNKAFNLVVENENYLYSGYSGIYSGCIETVSLDVSGSGSLTAVIPNGSRPFYAASSTTLHSATLYLYGKSLKLAESNLYLVGCELSEPADGYISSYNNIYNYDDSYASYAVITPITDPWLEMTESPAEKFSSDLGNLPTLTMKASAHNMDAEPDISYTWYSCDETGDSRIQIGTGTSCTAKAVIGRSYYVGKAVSGDLCAETKVITVDLAQKGLSVVSSLSFSSSVSQDNLESEGWKWDADTNTLTLKDITFINPSGTMVTCSTSGLNVAIEGSCHINAAIFLKYSNSADLNISGSGTLTSVRSESYSSNHALISASSYSSSVFLSDVTLNLSGQLLECGSITIDGADITVNELTIRRCLLTTSSSVTLQNKAVIDLSCGVSGSYFSKQGSTLTLDDATLNTGQSLVSLKVLSLQNGSDLTARSLSLQTLDVDNTSSLILTPNSLTVSGTATIAGTVSINSGSFQATELILDDAVQINIPEGGYYDSSDGYIKTADGETAAQIHIGEKPKEVTAVASITGDLYCGGIMQAGAVTPASATVTYQWQYSSPYSENWKDITGALSSTLDWASFVNRGDYVGNKIRVKVSGSGAYVGTVYSDPVELLPHPAYLKSAFINGDSVYLDDNGGYGYFNLDYTETSAALLVTANDADAVITINGNTGSSYEITDISDEAIFKVEIYSAYSGLSHSYKITVRKKTQPDHSYLGLDISKVSNLTEHDVLNAVWTAPDGSSGTLTADLENQTVNRDIPFNSEVVISAPHNDDTGAYPDICRLSLYNTDNDSMFYELPEIDLAPVCSCDVCGNAYRFTMNKGSVTYLLTDDCFAAPAPHLTADWDSDGSARFTVTLPDGQNALPNDPHNPNYYKSVSIYPVDADGNRIYDVSFADNIQTLTANEEQTALEQNYVLISAKDIDPNRTYYVKAEYSYKPSVRYMPDSYLSETVTLEARGQISLEPVSFGKTLVNGEYLDVYQNGIITLPESRDTEGTAYDIALSFAQNAAYASKIRCTLESDSEDTAAASYSFKDGSPTLTITAKEAGTAYLTMKASLFDQTLQLIWRVDVVKQTDSLRPQLETKTVTVNPSKTEYAKIQVLTSIHDYADSLSWEFAGKQAELLNSCFSLRQIDSHTLEILPNAKAIQNQGGPKKLASSYKIQLLLKNTTSHTQAYTKEFLTLKIDKKLPSVKAGSVKLNTFYQDASAEISLSAGTAAIRRVEINTDKNGVKDNIYGNWADFSYQAQTGTSVITAKGRNFKASGKLYLNVYFEGYSDIAPVAVTVPVSASASAPKLKLSAASLTLRERGANVPLSLMSADKKTAYQDLNVTNIRTLTDLEYAQLSAADKKTYGITTDYSVVLSSDFSESGKFFLRTAAAPAVSGKILLYAIIDGQETQRIPLTITVKNVSGSAVRFAKNSITFNSTLAAENEKQYVSIVTDCANWSLSQSQLSVSNSQGADASDAFTLTIDDTNRQLSIAPTSSCQTGTYKLSLNVPGIEKEAALTIKVQSKTPALSLSKKSITLNSLQNEGQLILVTSKDAGYEYLYQNNFKLTLKQGALLAAQAVDGGSIDHDALRTDWIWDSKKQTYGLQIAPNSPVTENYTLEISYRCPDGSYSKVSSLSVKLAAKTPVIKASAASVSVHENQQNQPLYLPFGLSVKTDTGYISHTLTEANGSVSDASCYVQAGISNTDRSSGGIIFTPSGLQPGKTYYLLLQYQAADSDGQLLVSGKTAKIKLSVLPDTAVPSASLSLKGNLDFSKADPGAVTITPKYINYMEDLSGTAFTGFEVFAKDGKNPAAEIEGYIDETGKLNLDKWFTITHQANGTYLLSLNQEEGSAYAENLLNAAYKYSIRPVITINGISYYGKTASLTIKQSTIKVSASQKTVTLCSGDRFDREYVRLSLTGNGWAEIRDVKAAPGSSSLYDITYYGDGLVAIRFKDNTAASKGGIVKLNVFTQGVTSDGDKVKANAVSSVSVKVVSVK